MNFQPFSPDELAAVETLIEKISVGGHGEWIVPSKLGLTNIFRLLATAKAGGTPTSATRGAPTQKDLRNAFIRGTQMQPFGGGRLTMDEAEREAEKRFPDTPTLRAPEVTDAPTVPGDTAAQRAMREKLAEEMKPLPFDQRVKVETAFGPWPRRASVSHYTPAEKAISDALAAVEAVGAHVWLTDAVILLGNAQQRVADYVDDQINKTTATTGRQDGDSA